MRISDNPIEIKLLEYQGLFLLKMISINSLVFLLYEYVDNNSVKYLTSYTRFVCLDRKDFTEIPFSIYDTESYLKLHVLLTKEEFNKRKKDFQSLLQNKNKYC